MKYFISLIFTFICFNSFAQDSIPVLQDSVSLIEAATNDTATNFKFNEVINSKTSTTAITLPSKKKKFNVDRVRILIGFNYSFYNPVVTEKDIFRGAYYPVKDSSPVWIDRETK